MTEPRRFRIFDLVVAVAAAGAGFGGIAYIEGNRGDRPGVGESVFWMTVAGFASAAYYIVRFVRGRSARLLMLAVTLAIAAATIGVYTALCMDFDLEVILPVGGLMAVAVVLAIGGVVHGLLDHWRELNGPAAVTPVKAASPSHPLDPESLP